MIAPIGLPGGVEIVLNDSLVEEVEVPRTKGIVLRLAEAILDWNPCNAELISSSTETIIRPSRQVYRHGPKFIMHPIVWEELKSHVDTRAKAVYNGLT